MHPVVLGDKKRAGKQLVEVHRGCGTGQFSVANQAASWREQLQAGFVGGGTDGIKHGGDAATAERIYRRLIKVDATDAAARFNLANLLRAADRAVEAEAMYRDATKAARRAQAHRRLGWRLPGTHRPRN